MRTGESERLDEPIATSLISASPLQPRSTALSLLRVAV